MKILFVLGSRGEWGYIKPLIKELIKNNIDYAICESQTIYGKIGVKVWVYKGEVVGKRNLSLNVGNKNSFKV